MFVWLILVIRTFTHSSEVGACCNTKILRGLNDILLGTVVDTTALSNREHTAQQKLIETTKLNK
jgi:hypothetical protein